MRATRAGGEEGRGTAGGGGEGREEVVTEGGRGSVLTLVRVCWEEVIWEGGRREEEKQEGGREVGGGSDRSRYIKRWHNIVVFRLK